MCNETRFVGKNKMSEIPTVFGLRSPDVPETKISQKTTAASVITCVPFPKNNNAACVYRSVCLHRSKHQNQSPMTRSGVRFFLSLAFASAPHRSSSRAMAALGFRQDT